MLLSGHQPTYLPGIILFTKIALSDAFMLVGHCQAGAKTWHKRNQIRNTRGGEGPLLLSVNIKHDFGQSINDTQFADNNWKRKHLRSIELTYRKRPFFDKYFPGLKECIELPWERLGPMNMALIELLCMWLRIETELLDSRDYHIEGHSTDMLVSMCEATKASGYLSNEGARDYVDEQSMNQAGIDHRWLKFEHPIYDQGAEFQTDLSVIDLLFNCGPEAGRIVRGAGYVG